MSTAVSKRDLALFYRGRVKDIISSRAHTAPPSTPVRELAGLMRDRGIGGVVVTGGDGRAVGIVTERDLVYKVVALGETDLTAGDIMSSPLVTIEPEQHLFEALRLMLKHRCRRLVVTDTRGELVGVLSMRDLLRLEGYEAQVIQRQVARSTSIQELAEVQPDIDHFAQKLLLSEVDARTIAELLTDMNDAITARIIRLNEHQIRAELREPPQETFAWLCMGSEGRREQVLRGDQDNALVHSGDPGGPAADYFRELAGRVNADLATYGFPLCDGGVMAREDKYFGAVEEWQARFYAVVRGVADGEVLRDLTILLDLRHVYGDHRLSDDLWGRLLRELERFPPALRAIADDSVNKPVPLGFLGRLQYEKDGRGRQGINLKRYGMLPLVAGVKALAVEEGVTATGTADRIVALRERDRLLPEDASNLLAALELFLKLKLQVSLDQIFGRSAGQFVYPQEWTEWEREDLKRAFRTVEQLEGLLRFRFSL